jgi:hypothetical protein
MVFPTSTAHNRDYNSHSRRDHAPDTADTFTPAIVRSSSFSTRHIVRRADFTTSRHRRLNINAAPSDYIKYRGLVIAHLIMKL